MIGASYLGLGAAIQWVRSDVRRGGERAHSACRRATTSGPSSPLGSPERGRVATQGGAWHGHGCRATRSCLRRLRLPLAGTHTAGAAAIPPSACRRHPPDRSSTPSPVAVEPWPARRDLDRRRIVGTSSTMNRRGAPSSRRTPVGDRPPRGPSRLATVAQLLAADDPARGAVRPEPARRPLDLDAGVPRGSRHPMRPGDRRLGSVDHVRRSSRLASADRGLEADAAPQPDATDRVRAAGAPRRRAHVSFGSQASMRARAPSSVSGPLTTSRTRPSGSMKNCVGRAYTLYRLKMSAEASNAMS